MHRVGRIFRDLMLGLGVCLISGCGPGFVNQPSNALTVSPEHRALNTNPRTESFIPLGTDEEENTMAPPGASRPSRIASTEPAPPRPGMFVGLAISGGGSRSANFAAATMFQLERLGLLRQVDCISAVSGGTLAAAYYCSALDADWNPKIVQEKLTHEFTSDTLYDVLWPPNLLGLTVGNLTRADLLADHLGGVLFKRDGRRLTFGDLRPDRPSLLINCTTLETGQRFTFDNGSFDQINSNLRSYPLEYAVTASSAIPVIMQPVALRDFSTEFPQYYHLLDGGVSDNLGVQSLVQTYEARIRQQVNPYPRGAVLIIIDAGTPFNRRFVSKPVLSTVDSLLSGLDLSSTMLVNRASSATLSEVVMMHSQASYTAEQLRKLVEQLRREHYIEVNDTLGNKVRVVHISLSQVGELADISFGTSINTISTDFDITKAEAYELYKAADILFRERFDARLTPLIRELEQ